MVLLQSLQWTMELLHLESHIETVMVHHHLMTLMAVPGDLGTSANQLYYMCFVTCGVHCKTFVSSYEK